jgi:hypothetical protein
MTRKRLWGALACLGALAGLAAITLDQELRIVVWIFLGGLAVKSWIAAARERQD